jgi:hypothetical protein
MQNPNVWEANVLANRARSDYNGLQVEARRRLSKGLAFQANYTWSKVLADASGLFGVRYEPYLDGRRPKFERSRAEFDIPHAFKANVIYDLPFGDGYGLLGRLVGGWELTSIVTWQTGPPFGIYSDRGTLNYLFQSRDTNTAVTSLTADQIRSLFGIVKRPDGIFFINPAVRNPHTGTAVADDGAEPFPGQVFFNPEPGQVGNLERLMFNGPSLFTWDMGVSKRTRLTQRTSLELRAEFFNVLNHPVFAVGDQDINSGDFGRVSGVQVAPRVIQLAARLSF